MCVQLPSPTEVMFSVMLVCLSVIIVANNERICMNLLPQVCLGLRNNSVDLGDGLDPGCGLRSGSRVYKRIFSGDPGGLQSVQMYSYCIIN